MATRARTRDYRLSGGPQGAVALDDEELEARVEETWWHPDIPRSELKAFMKRSDIPALWDFGLWIALTAGSGYLVALSWGSWWAIPAFLVFGASYTSSDARWHECGHGTAFKTRWLNELFYHLSSFMSLHEAYLWRWSHSRHHTNTIMVGLDPEIQVQRPADLFRIAMDFFYLRTGSQEVIQVVRSALARPNAQVRDFVPPEERAKMVWSSRVYVTIWLGFGVWSLAVGSFLPMMFVILPRFYGGWLHQLLGLTQHTGLAEDTFDHRENTRTVHINPVFRYLYLNMNWHMEHHAIPMIPYHALPALAGAIADQTPTPYPNLWSAYREMIPALIEQATKDPDYYIERDIPVGGVAHSSTEIIGETPGKVLAGNWVEACSVHDVDEEDVLDITHDGKRYAIYRLQGDDFYASDGLCTHEEMELEHGLVLDGCIECPLHNGVFDIKTGRALKAPVHQDLRTYPTELRGDRVFVDLAP